MPLSPADLDRIFQWNSEIPQAIDTTVHSIIQSRIDQHPESEAVCSWDGTLTFNELNDFSSKLADYLITNGVRPETIVPLCFEKSMWTIVSLLAVLKAGGAFLLLDFSQPVERLKLIVQQTSAKLILSSLACLDRCKAFAGQSFVVSASTLAGLERQSNHRSVDIQPHNAAYLIFTSGSTGTPKGIVIEHSQLATTSISAGEKMGYVGRPRVFQFASYAFDACITDMFATLAHGGTVCIPSEWERNNSIVGAMRRTKATSAKFTPSLASNLALEDVPTLETLVLGGESAPASLVERWAGRFRLVLVYGPSECCVICFTSDVSQRDPVPSEIGWPTAARAWIVKQGDCNILADFGETGELLIEGPLVGRGYLNDQPRTDSQFIKVPPWMPASLEAPEQGRMYRTGDLVRYLNDGTVCYVGRIDNQVKIRGQRLELEEVEHRLHGSLDKLSGLHSKQVIVEAAMLSGMTHKQLVAFICLDATESLGSLNLDVQESASIQTSDPKRRMFHALVDKVEESMKHHLPSYAIPSIWIPLQDAPLTVSRKIDRRRLRNTVAKFSPKELAIFTSAPPDQNEPRAGSQASEAELILQKLWANIFGVDTSSVAREDNFFFLGGDSVLAIKLIAAARARGLDLTLNTVFDRPVLSHMASATGRLTEIPGDIASFALLNEAWDVEQVRNEASKECQVPKESIKDIYPCSPMQEGLLALSMKDPGTYILQFVYQMPESIDLVRLRASWEAVSKRTQIMRTRFFNYSMDLLQAVIDEPLKWAVVEEDLGSFLGETKKRVLELGEAMSQHTVIIQQNPRQYFLVWNVHHALIDGWSESDIVTFVEQEYLKSPSYASSVPSFNTFIKHINQQNHDSARKFWIDQLAGTPAPIFPPLPDSTYIPKVQRSNRVSHHLDSHEEAELQHKVASVKRGSTTAATIAQAAWALLIGTYSNESDVVTGVTLNGRTAPIPGIDLMPGPTVTTIPFRTRYSPDQKVTDLLQTIQKQYLTTLPFAQFGLQNIRNLNSDAIAACNFRTLLVVQSSNRSQETRELLIGRSYSFPVMDFALVVECELHRGSIDLRATFDHQVLSEMQVRRMLRQMDNLIHRFSTAERLATVSEMLEISQADKLEILQWNREQNASTWIVDPDDPGRLTPIGGVGELLVEMPAASTAEDLQNQAAFVDNPVWSRLDELAGRRCFYRTGDLASYNENGTVESLGHKDDLAKLHGRSFDLAIVEERFRKCISTPAGVVTAVIRLKEGDEALAAFVVVDDHDGDAAGSVLTRSPKALDQVRALVKDAGNRLRSMSLTYPEPSVYIPIREIPRTASGRVDRGKLQSEALAISTRDVTYGDEFMHKNSGFAAPSTDLERRIQELWKILLGTTQIGCDDDFFELGGGSVMAMRLVSMARKAGITMTVGDIFRSRTLRELSSASHEDVIATSILPFALLKGIDTTQVRNEAASQCGVTIEQVEDVYPCSAMQLHYVLGYLEAKRGPSHPWNWQSQVVYSMPPSLDLSRFEAAWQSAIRRHTALRTRLVETSSGEIYQAVIRESGPLNWMRDTDLERYIQNDRNDHMTFGSKLLRLCTIQHDNSGDRFFVMTIHHTTYDAFARSLLFKEVEAAYLDAYADTTSPEMNKFIQHITQADKTAATDFWSSQLAGTITKPLLSCVEHRNSLNQVEKTKVMDIPALDGAPCTLPTMIEVASGLAIAYMLDSPDVVFYSDRSGRNLPVEGIQDLVGPTTLFLPVRVHVDRQQRVKDLLKEAQNIQSTMIQFEHVGWLELRQIPHIRPYLQHSLNININPHRLASLGHKLGLEYKGSHATFDDPFGINVDLDDGNMHWQVYYDERFIDDTRVDSLLKTIESVFAQLVDVFRDSELTVGVLLDHIKQDV